LELRGSLGYRTGSREAPGLGRTPRKPRRPGGAARLCVGPRSNPQDTERPAERQAARFAQEKIWRGTAMSKGCAETVGDTSDDNPDPESPWKRRGQAARKGGRERGRKTRRLGRLPGESPGTEVRNDQCRSQGCSPAGEVAWNPFSIFTSNIIPIFPMPPILPIRQPVDFLCKTEEQLIGLELHRFSRGRVTAQI
jgi:hypothetical protein